MKRIFAGSAFAIVAVCLVVGQIGCKGGNSDSTNNAQGQKNMSTAGKNSKIKGPGNFTATQ